MPKSRAPQGRRARGGLHGATGIAVGIIVAALGTACGSSQQSVQADPGAQAIASVGARLRGQWKLERFDPVEPLGPVLQALVEFQYANMVIRMEANRMTATSPGVNVDRAYEIREAYGDRFKVVIFDEQGVPYESSCTFVGDGATVQAQTTSDPWRGAAVLRKVGP